MCVLKNDDCKNIFPHVLYIDVVEKNYYSQLLHGSMTLITQKIACRLPGSVPHFLISSNNRTLLELLWEQTEKLLQNLWNNKLLHEAYGWIVTKLNSHQLGLSINCLYLFALHNKYSSYWLEQLSKGDCTQFSPWLKAFFLIVQNKSIML